MIWSRCDWIDCLACKAGNWFMACMAWSAPSADWLLPTRSASTLSSSPEVLRHLCLHLHRGLQAVERVPPTLLRIAVHLVAADGGGVLLGIQARKLPINSSRRRRAAGLRDQPLGRRQIGAQLVHYAGRQAGEVARWFISICASF